MSAITQTQANPAGDLLEEPARDDPRWKSDFTHAPKDGSPVWLWVVHRSARYCRDPIAEGFEAPVRAEWIDHNCGGWTWCGLAGSIVMWMPRTDGLTTHGKPIHPPD